MATKKLSPAKQAKALALVAAWMGKEYYMGPDFTQSPAPTGQDAAYSGRGPMLAPEWDWTGTPTPTILLEGGPDDWAYYAPAGVQEKLTRLGIWCEPYASYALSLYVDA